MSNAALQGGAGGTGTVTLLAPSTSTNRTLTLPDLSGTVAVTDTEQSFSAKQTFTNTVKLQQALEKVTITASTPATNFDCLTQGVQYFTTNTSATWTLNFRGDGSNSLNSIMAVGESITVTILVTQGATAYLPSAYTIDGTSVTPKWPSTPTGDASSINALSYTIIKTASATFTVLASKSKYA